LDLAVRFRVQVVLPPVVVALLVAVVVAPGARAEGLHRTSIGIHCVVTGVEGAGTLQSCEATVEDGSPEPTPPTGTVTFQHAITCTLAPISAAESACDFPLTTPAAGEFKLSAEYSGDPTHAHSELFVEWNVSYVGNEIWIDPMFVPIPYLPAPEKTGSKTAESEAKPTPVAAKARRPRIDARPSKRTRRRVAQFRFAGAGPFECKLDSGPYRSCGGAFHRRVSIGKHVLRVRPAGASGPVATFRWRVLPKAP
jgi:hypothetical protein